jgi:hypothetical protein
MLLAGVGGAVACGGDEGHDANGTGQTGGAGGTSGVDVQGSWCGADVATPAQCVGDEVMYLEFTSSAGSLTGRFCDEYQGDCYDFTSASVAGNRVTIEYSWFESAYATTFVVTGTFTLDGDQMTGSLHSTKCNCDTPATLHRL